MEAYMLTPELIGLLDKREFISVATSDLNSRPNAAPKFILKVDKGHIYLVDYIIGTTYENLRKNPRVSLSFMDQRTLRGYQLNGKAHIIDKGRSYSAMRKEMLDKEIRLTTKHIIEDVRGQSKHDTFEVTLSERYVIFVITIDEVVEIGPRGDLIRKKMPSQ
jgi:general stress protein 26